MDPVAATDQIRAGFRDIAKACALLRRELEQQLFTRDEAVSLVETWLGSTILAAGAPQLDDEDT